MRCSAYYSSRARAWPRCILGKRNLPRVGLATSPTRPAMPVCFPTTQLGQEKIGEKTTVHDLFDRWVLNESVRAGRGKYYAEVTKDCKGKIELDFSLTPTQWQNSARRKRYYRSIGRLVIKVGRQLLADFGNQLSGTEKTAFMRALHALAWQESLWQHYIRYKNWFFVVLSGGSYTTCSTIGVLPKSHAPTALQTSLSTNASSRRKGTARSGARSTTASWNIISSTWTRAASHVTTVSWTSCSARTISTRRGSATVTTNFLKTKSTSPTRPERLPDSATTTRIVRG